MRPYLLPRRLAGSLMLGLLVLACVHYAGILSLDTLWAALPCLCPFRALSGIPCPGCGMTGALLALAKGDLIEAVAHNPFSMLLLFLAGLSLLPDRALKRLPSQAHAIMSHFLILSLLSVGFYWLAFRVLPLVL
jgi:hypothetical protein